MSRVGLGWIRGSVGGRGEDGGVFCEFNGGGSGMGGFGGLRGVWSLGFWGVRRGGKR